MLCPEHAEHFARFGITPKLIETAGIRSVTDFEARELLSVNGNHRGEKLAGIYFPSFDPQSGQRNGARIRLDNPINGAQKYIAETGSRHLYFVRGAADVLNDTTVPLLFVEAEKSALALAALAERSDKTIAHRESQIIPYCQV